MMPPKDPIAPAEGDVAPNPMEILALGGDRWLAPTGRVLTFLDGTPVDITPGTRKFWEDAALRGSGVPLSELLL